MFSDPLTLAITSLIIGIVLGAALAVLAVMFLTELSEPAYPSDADIEAMYADYMEYICE